ncbi:helix-turn-helix transcriptional regulator [Pararhizobium haloflavum]|uniref:helix-turn-helix transcriptional regulator n=1 Tax=Pararhizobium haloflavum TaxID=2037914 RepID=UPI001FDED8C1|nr:LuxR family transcriptional regulator [Pararhizobium haloflavum]
MSAADSVDRAVHLIRDMLRFDHCTYHLAWTIDAKLDAPFVKSTYSETWLGRYIMRRYVNVDPVVIHGFQRQLPFFWSDLPLDPKAEALMVDAIAHGVGMQGYTIPIVDRSRRRAILSVTGHEDDPQAWLSFIDRFKMGLNEIAHSLHKMAVREIYGEDTVPLLGPREIECLIWSAQGKSHKDIATILSISEHTARGYLTTARLKLDSATIAQAVAKAIKLNLIDEPV